MDLKIEDRITRNLNTKTDTTYNDDNGLIDNNQDLQSHQIENIDEKNKRRPFFTHEEIVYPHLIKHIILVVLGLYYFMTFPYIERYKSIIWAYFTSWLSLFGVCAGVHRLYSHRAYKAKLPLRIILAFCYISSMLTTFSKWVNIHRLHHKYSDTELDPHNSRRGFFYSHVGWLVIKRPRIIKEKLKTIDMSDIYADPVVKFSDRHFYKLSLLINLLLIAVPVLFWNESWYYAFISQYMRFVWVIHVTLSINSFTHLWGYKPYNKNIPPVYNKWTNFLTFGEGLHNYHHSFPSDYRTPEFDSRFDLTGLTLDLFAKIGWAHDLKRPSENLVKMVIENKGDAKLLKSLI